MLGRMSSPSRDEFHISLEELVQSARVPVEEQISEHEWPGAVMPQPDVNIQNTIIWAAGAG
ncbi:MAG: hypothetical protein QOG34_2359 [Frankiaceae bacterium]|nr:hypothetical protein [Frankiaceae bacterium]